MHSVKTLLAWLAILNERTDKNTIDFENVGCQHHTLPSAHLAEPTVFRRRI